MEIPNCEVDVERHTLCVTSDRQLLRVRAGMVTLIDNQDQQMYVTEESIDILVAYGLMSPFDTNSGSNPSPQTEPVKTTSMSNPPPHMKPVNAASTSNPSLQMKPVKAVSTSSPSPQMEPVKVASTSNPPPHMKPVNAASTSNPSLQMKPVKAASTSSPSPQMEPVKVASTSNPSPHMEPVKAASTSNPSLQIKPVKAASTSSPSPQMETVKVASTSNPSPHMEPVKAASTSNPSLQIKPVKAASISNPLPQCEPVTAAPISSHSLQSDLMHIASTSNPISETEPAVSIAPSSCPSSSTSQSCKQVLLWTNPAALFLISEWSKYEEEFNSDTIRNDVVWQKIRTEMGSAGFGFSIRQIKDKWNNMRKVYMKTRDHNSQSGAEQKVCKFYTEFDQLFGKTPTVCPVSLASSRKSKSPQPELDSEGDIHSDSSGEIKKQNVKKLKKTKVQRELQSWSQSLLREAEKRAEARQARHAELLESQNRAINAYQGTMNRLIEKLGGK